MVNVVLCGSVQMDCTAMNPAYFLLIKDATVFSMCIYVFILIVVEF